jgi:zinc transport system substrate-binding protein
MTRLALIPALLLSGAALADVPSVVTDIPPVHGLVSMVMGDLGSPALLVEPGASPHGYALRPSQAAALQDADAVFWVGHELAPWLEGPLERLSDEAMVVELLETEGTLALDFRQNAVFARDDHAADDDHDAHEGDHDDHAHEGTDPHAWLDPENALAWLEVIAGTLAVLDPENADVYRQNAMAAHAEIAAASASISARLTPLSDRPFIVFHDAFQYFESRFDLAGAGAISMSDATAPSAARVAEIRAEVTEHGVVCVFSEPQFNPGLVDTVANGADLRHGVIDPLGTAIPLGAGFYPALIDSVAEAMESCLTGA